jgi:hypothetical protein
MELLPIKEKFEDNIGFVNNPSCHESLYMTIEFYKKTGYNQPWICYYAKHNNTIIGSVGFKGKPISGQIEIAYGTFEQYRKQGFGTAICKQLVDLSIRTDPSLKLPQEHFLKKMSQPKYS